MKIEQTTIQKTFTIKHNGKVYYVDYLNADGQILGLINRNNWEINDQENELLDIYTFKGQSKRKNEKVKKNRELAEKLVRFCIKHFEDYNPVKESGEPEAVAKRGEIKLHRK